MTLQFRTVLPRHLPNHPSSQICSLYKYPGWENPVLGKYVHGQVTVPPEKKLIVPTESEWWRAPFVWSQLIIKNLVGMIKRWTPWSQVPGSRYQVSGTRCHLPGPWQHWTRRRVKIMDSPFFRGGPESRRLVACLEKKIRRQKKTIKQRKSPRPNWTKVGLLGPGPIFLLLKKAVSCTKKINLPKTFLFRQTQPR